MALKKNDLIEIEITGMTSEGSGVGRYCEQAIFVANCAIGDVLKVRIIKPSKKYAVGKIEQIITPSNDRIAPDCDCFLQCGGCTYRHITYEAELEIKQQRVSDAIERIGGFNHIKVNKIVSCKSRNAYRNKAQLPVGKDKDNNFIMGFYAYHSHRIINCDNCSLQPEIFTKTINIFRLWAEKYKPEPYAESTHSGKLRHLYIRYGEATGDVMVCIVVNGNGLKGEYELAQMLAENIDGFKSLIVNTNREKTNVILGKKCRTVWGSDYITDILCGLKFNISPLSFYQVNRAGAKKLYSIAGEYADLSKGQVLLDLYCGTGTIGLTMADRAKELIGVEIIPQAVENAKENAKLNDINNARFICADAAAAAKQLKEEGITPDVIIVDPPRKGCDKELIATIAQMNPKRAVYVSCDPATLARDLKLFNEQGYIPKQITPVDMFPCTPHVETVCLLSRVEK